MKSEALKHAMYYGMMLGGALILMFLVGLIPQPFIRSILNLGSIVLVVWLTYRFSVDCRNKLYDGTWSYGQAFWYLIRLCFYGSLVSSVVVLIYSFVNVSFLNGLLNQSMEVLSAMEDVDGVDMSALEDSLAMLFTPQTYASIYMVSSLFCGFVTSLIVAAIVKEDNPFANQNISNESEND